VERLEGIVTAQLPYMIVTELPSNGSLLDFIRVRFIIIIIFVVIIIIIIIYFFFITDYYIISSTSCLSFYFYCMFGLCINTMHCWLLLLCMSLWFSCVYCIVFHCMDSPHCDLL